MSRGIFVIGTDTEVGKTVVCAGLLHLFLQAGLRAAYFKPVASGEMDVNGVSIPGDAAFVCAASGWQEDFNKITPYSFADLVAPHLAARLAGRNIEQAPIRQALNVLKSRYDWIIAEAAGGLAVPLNDEGLMQYQLICELNFPCLLVARTGLGTINHTLLTLQFAQDVGLTVKGLVLNRAGDTMIEKDNVMMLKKLSGLKAVFTLPALMNTDTEKNKIGNLRKTFEDNLCTRDITNLMDVI